MAHVAFTTPGIDRVFIACTDCGRVMPHYRAYGRVTKRTDGMCRCGGTTFKPKRLRYAVAAWWVLVVGWLWRKTIRSEREWDPRMPLKQRAR